MSVMSPPWPILRSDTALGGIRALALDYDGTIAENGQVAPATASALRRLGKAGFRLILVSGRRVENIRAVCDILDLFDAVILENGAVSYCPTTGAMTLLAKPASTRILAAIEDAFPGEPVFVGNVLIAMSATSADRLADLIRRGGHDLAIIGCGQRVIILPSGINKQSGLCHALSQLDLRHQEVAAVGDEANDLDLYQRCGLKIAVANAAPGLKAAADLVLPANGGEGFCWLANRLIELGR